MLAMIDVDSLGKSDKQTNWRGKGKSFLQLLTDFSGEKLIHRIFKSM